MPTSLASGGATMALPDASMHALFWRSAISVAPRAAETGRTSPRRESSPTHMYSAKLILRFKDKARTLRAIGRSNVAPFFGRSAGERLTTTFPLGNWNPCCLIAARTRSRDSRTAASGSPTIVKEPRRPWVTVASILTSRGSTPTRVHDVTDEYMPPTYVGGMTQRRPDVPQRGCAVEDSHVVRPGGYTDYSDVR